MTWNVGSPSLSSYGPGGGFLGSNGLFSTPGLQATVPPTGLGSADGYELGNDPTAGIPPERLKELEQKLDDLPLSPALKAQLRQILQQAHQSENNGVPSASAANPDVQGLDPLGLAELLLQRAGGSQPGRPLGALGQGMTGPSQPTSWNGGNPSAGNPGGYRSLGRSNPGGPSANNEPAAPSGPIQPINLNGDDKKTAASIDRFLQSKGSPAAGQGPPSAGEMMVDAGHKYGVDPMVLLSIAGQETGFGKLGVGMQKWMGVSAYDANPSGANPKYDGLRNQIYEGAKTFARLRAKGGASENSDIGTQLAAANRAGWATDGNWHNGVGSWYQRIAQFVGSDSNSAVA